MVFSSVPVYLDPPNWHHQQLNQATGSENPQQLPPVVVLPSAAEASHNHVAGVGGQGGCAGSIIRSTAGSMAADHRPRSLGNINNKVVQQPEVALNCPRCNSTNTKFCYFNNYSLSQPRHFCKTCRRYWTRGGALRNVPVGGGCRRNNKKSKSSSSKSSSSANNDQKQQQQPQVGNGNTNSTSTLNIPSVMIGQLQQQPQQQEAAAHHDLPLMATLHNLSQYNQVWNSSNNNNNIGFSFLGGGSSHGTDHVGFQVGSITNSSMSGSSLVGLHQFPFFEAPNINTAGVYSFQNENENDIIEDPSSSLAMAASNSRVSDEQQQAPGKMKDHHQQHNNQYNWSAAGNNWTDLSGLNQTSPATTVHHHLL